MAEYEIIEGVKVTRADEWEEIDDPSRLWLVIVPLALVAAVMLFSLLINRSGDPVDEVQAPVPSTQITLTEPASTIPGGVFGIPTELEVISINDGRLDDFRSLSFLAGAPGQPLTVFSLDETEPRELGVRGEPLLAADNWLFVSTSEGVGVFDMSQADPSLRLLADQASQDGSVRLVGDEVWVYGIDYETHFFPELTVRRFAIGSFDELPAPAVVTYSWGPVAALESAPGGGVYEYTGSGYQRRANGSLVSGNRDYALIRDCGSPLDCQAVLYERSNWDLVDLAGLDLDTTNAHFVFLNDGPLAVSFEQARNGGQGGFDMSLIDFETGLSLSLQLSALTEDWEPITASPDAVLVWSGAGLSLIDRGTGELLAVDTGSAALPPQRFLPLAVASNSTWLSSGGAND